MQLPFQSAPKHLCLIRLSAIGDVCHTLAVVRTIQSHWPNTKLTWIIGKLEYSLIGDIPGIQFVLFDKSIGWRAYHKVYKTLGSTYFDALLMMQISLRATLISLILNSPIRLGFDKSRAKDFQWIFSTHKIEAQPNGHVIQGLFGFAKALGVSSQHLQWAIPIPQRARDFAIEHLPGPGKALIISPCSSDRFRNWRNWSPERYAQICDYAAEKYAMRVVLSGGPSTIEKNMGDDIMRLCKHKPVNLIGATNLKQLLALIERAHLVISPDSGPAHIACAVGTTVIGLYVTSNPERTGPVCGSRYLVNKYPLAVKQYMNAKVEEIRWGARVRHPDAMQLISVDDVRRSIDKFMVDQLAADKAKKQDPINS